MNISEKHLGELSYWKSRLAMDNGQFKNSHYRTTMLAMADEKDADFVRGKVIADFECGPRGSLVWAGDAALRIGIDVLSDLYADEFWSNITSHSMIYLKSTERSIPLPSDFVDVMFTMNALDHVDHLPVICRELVRVIKPGGELIASFNLNEPATREEPQTLTEKLLENYLLKYFELGHSRKARRNRGEGSVYDNFFKSLHELDDGEEGFLWVRAIKKQTTISL